MSAVLPALGLSLLLVASGYLGELPAVTLGQIDDFQDETTQNWAIGSVVNPPPLVVIGNGQGGAGDHFLQYSSSGSQTAGGRMILFNRVPSQWNGDYLAEGITSLQMDIRNTGNVPLHLRVGFNSLFGESGTWFVSNEAIFFGPGPDWVTLSFPIESGNLTRVSGADGYDAVMSNVRSLRLLSSENPAFRGDPIVTTVGIDNVRAVPEPSSGMLVGLVGIALLSRRRECS